ncbi:hypothetical protein L7F22_008762 [Adiantum nelumboides]|nr:hypothetical protein [Adiantum nelumboides]
MRKLFNLRMKESASVASHINDFDSLFAQIHAQQINIDDELKAIFLLCSLPPSWDIFCTAVSNSAPNAHYVQKDGKQRKGRSWNRESKKEGNRDASKGRSKSPGHRNVQCHYCDKFGHIKKDCYAWKRDKGKGKYKDNDAKEKKPKSSIKIEELNIVQDDCDAQDINMLTENNDVFYDAQETLSLQSSMPAELLVSGEVSHTWILNLGASLHVTPHRQWFTTYEETIGTVTLGDSYSCDIVGIGDIAMVMANGVKFIIHNVRHVPALTRNLISVGRLDDLGYKVTFHQQSWRIAKSHLILAHGSKFGTLYPLYVSDSILSITELPIVAFYLTKTVFFL